MKMRVKFLVRSRNKYFYEMRDFKKMSKMSQGSVQ